MKRITHYKNSFLLIFLFLGCSSFAQNYIPFTPRFDQDVRGDIVLIGNNILGPNNEAFNESSVYNHNVDMRYIDIDDDTSTYSSSSADLEIPNPNCYQIIYAGLYWGAVTGGSESITEVQLKGPTGVYNDVTGTVIYNADDNITGNSFPYSCYADVTDIISNLENDLGTYTVANVSSAQGETSSFDPYNGTGYSAGWSLFIVYEDPTMPGKSITSFDGFSAISSSVNLDVPVSGFRTVPEPAPVRANFAFAALEGDKPIRNDLMLINDVNLSTIDRPANNFFNSSVTRLDATVVTNRNPNSTNTLGFDTGVMVVPNPNNMVIANDATNATVRLESNQDTYFEYFFAFAVEIIEPNIVLTKVVEDAIGNNIGGQLVNLGDELNYVIGFQNTGNDSATNITIRDILPTNIVFNYPEDIISLPPGVSVESYNFETREIIFRIDEYIVEENDPISEIRFKVKVVSTCSLLNDACSNIVTNQAFATYYGTLNSSFIITDDPSISTNVGCLLTPAATNFLANITCVFSEEVILCGDSVQLTAADGYDAYSWSTSPTGIPEIGTTQSIMVTTTGTYYSFNTAVAPCQSIDQEYEVITFGANVPNPVIPYADQIVVCPNDGKDLPNIFLCGASDTRFIQTGITDATSIIWEKLDESSCPTVSNQDCANENSTCIWNEVNSGPDFLIDTSGQYRLTLNYDGGCFNQFYFNVFTNLLNPSAITKDIICNTPGEIFVNDVPSGYEYSIDGVNYQENNVFSVSTPGIYTIYIRQIGITPNPCIFTVPEVQIRERTFTVSTIITQPYCHGDLGSVHIAANDVDPQYFFSIYQDSTLVNSVGPIIPNDYSFNNLNPGIYTVEVSTEDGCFYSNDIEIIDPPLLTATAAITKAITCTDGEITVYPNGGTPPYFYFVNSTTEFQTTPVIPALNPGDYNITVTDSNNCSVDLSISIEITPSPEFYIETSDILCSDSGVFGIIYINVTNPHGNILKFSIDGGNTFYDSSTFSGLSEGDYDVVIQYEMGEDTCFTVPQTVTITAIPAIQGVADVTTQFSCDSYGSITVLGVTGGTPPYTYSLDGTTFQTGNIFAGLTSGAFTVTIKDANNCSSLTIPVTIDPLNPPSDLDFNNTPLTCPELKSDVTITSTTGGVGMLEYRILAPIGYETTYQTSNIFLSLDPGTYTFKVKDFLDCTYIESHTIAPIPPITVSTILTKDLDCTSTPNAIISGVILEGSAPFTYEVAYNSGAYTALGSTNTNFEFSTPNHGNYQFKVTDSNGCSAESNIQYISAISLPEIASITATPNLCSGDLNGALQITLNTVVGTPSFTINVFNTSTGTDYGSQINGLPSGNYTITLTDAKFCTDTKMITILEPDPIVVNYHVIDISCVGAGLSKGSILIDNVTGGTAPYTYYVTGSNGYSENEFNASGTVSTSFNDIDFGMYQIDILDTNGCSRLVQDVLVASPPNDLDIDISTTVDCLIGGEAYVSIGTNLVGIGPFYFDIYRGEIPLPPPGGTWLSEDTPGSQSATFSGLTPGVTYTFIVYDSFSGCSYFEQAAIPTASSSTLVINALTVNNISCVGNADGNVSFSVNSSYSLPVDIDYEVFNLLSLLPVGIAGSDTISSNGSISVENLGPLGLGAYFILIKETSGSNSGCGVVTIPFNILESSLNLNISATVEKNANCNLNSGIISAIATNGTAPYLYQITTTEIPPSILDSNWLEEHVFNVDANSYYVHVLDAYGCIKSTPVIVLLSDSEPAITATSSNQCSVLEGNYEINVSLTAPGVPPYLFSVNGGAFQTKAIPFTLTNLAAGNHSIEIKDINGCGNFVSLTLEPSLVLMPNLLAEPSCNNDDGQISIVTNGGSGLFDYSINPSPDSISLNGNSFLGVPAGWYTITVNDVATMCSEEAEIFVPNAASPFLSIESDSVECFGDDTGTFELRVNGYFGSYDYEVFDVNNNSVFGLVSTTTTAYPEIVTGLGSGIYTVQVSETEFPFCTSLSEVVISSPINELTLAVSKTSNVTCFNIGGTITAIASDGWGDYQYELTGDRILPYSTNGTFTDLNSGTYTINAKDAGGCIVSETLILSLPNPIDATITTNSNLLSCFGDTNGIITVASVTGGQGFNYTYTLNMTSPNSTSSGPQTSNIFTNLAPGIYNVMITDGFNCEFISPDIIIIEPEIMAVDLVAESPPTCVLDATLTLRASGGTGIYTFSDDIDFTTILGTFSTSISFSVTPGTYMYYVKDSNGCIASVSNEITIDSLPELYIDLERTDVIINCAGDNSGVIVANAYGGLGAYVYTLQDDMGIDILPEPIQTAPGVFSDLPAGIYRVKVDSGDCLTQSEIINIREPQSPLIANFTVSNITCSGANNGVVEILASGGTGIIKYAISPQLNQFFEISVFENLASGIYQAIAQDELGCFSIIDFTINESIPILLEIVDDSLFPEVCEGVNDGEFSIDISGGSLPYSVSLDDSSGVFTTGTLTQTQFDFYQLSGGNHIVYVRDALGCESEWNITFPNAILIDPQVDIEYGCADNSQSNMVIVSVDASISNLADVDYSLDGGAYQTNYIFENVSAGIDHYIDVRHTNGCIQRTATFNIPNYQSLNLLLVEGEINEIIAQISGGSAPYEYTLNGNFFGTLNTFQIEESGTYFITVTDSMGCVVSAYIDMEFTDVCISNYFTPNGDGVLDDWGPSCAQQYPNLIVAVFDRYGRTVATLRQGEKWDGKYQGNDLPTGDYWYMVKLNDAVVKQDFVGHFTLYR
ncbi:T9SS type B sorting domain-containing protein [Flavobacteriaceae bacterium]|nr:T9SS type B sorting domain-containing protein [Flavobacteriaceae bacterium]